MSRPFKYVPTPEVEAAHAAMFRDYLDKIKGGYFALARRSKGELDIINRELRRRSDRTNK